MRKTLLTVMAAMAAMTIQAQTELPVQEQAVAPEAATVVSTPIIGYLSYDEAMQAMPQQAIVEQQMATLQQSYDQEMKRVEDEFNQKYEAFLEGRKDFPRTILLKRQTELQEMLQRNVDFKAQAQKELEQARRQAMAPLRARLNEAIGTVARRHELFVVVNTDADATPFIEPTLAIDITQEVKLLLAQ